MYTPSTPTQASLQEISCISGISCISCIFTTPWPQTPQFPVLVGAWGLEADRVRHRRELQDEGAAQVLSARRYPIGMFPAPLLSTPKRGGLELEKNVCDRHQKFHQADRIHPDFFLAIRRKAQVPPVNFPIFLRCFMSVLDLGRSFADTQFR